MSFHGRGNDDSRNLNLAVSQASSPVELSVTAYFMEAPEVETIVRDMRTTVVGRCIAHVQVLQEALVQPLTGQQFGARLIGTTVMQAERRGKHIVVHLNDGQKLVIHLKMTGQIRYSSTGAAADAYLGLILRFEDGSRLSYHDKLRWGHWYLLGSGTDLSIIIPRLGPDFLSGECTPHQLHAILKNSDQCIHTVLLNQRRVGGLGNIYVNEVLFQAQIDPQRHCSTLSEAETQHLHQVIVEILQDALSHRGTTFSDYRDLFGHKGGYQDYLKVFKRQGTPCVRCGVLIRKIKLHGRSVFFCPQCQRQ